MPKCILGTELFMSAPNKSVFRCVPCAAGEEQDGSAPVSGGAREAGREDTGEAAARQGIPWRENERERKGVKR